MNKDKISSASKSIRVGDVLTVTLERRVLVLRIQALGKRRGPFEEARKLYEDLSPPPPPKEAPPPQAPGRRDAGAGRPTKRDRRKLDALRNDD